MENLTPVEIVALFDRYVYGQTQAKKMLAIALRNRYRANKLNVVDRMSVHKQNLLIEGPTGTGKTALMRVLKTKFGLPVLELDMTAFTESGYVGREVTSIGKDLADLARSVELPDWYIELRTKRRVETEVDGNRLTREEWERESRKEVERELDERAAERQLRYQAKRDHTELLRRQGILDPKELYEEYQDIYCLRAFMVGYCRQHNLTYEDFDIYSVTLGGRTVQEWIDKMSEIARSLLGVSSISELLNSEELESQVDKLMDGDIPGTIGYMGEFMSLMALGEQIDLYVDAGQALMSNNLPLSCADGSDFYDLFDTFNGDDEDVEPVGIIGSRSTLQRLLFACCLVWKILRSGVVGGMTCSKVLQNLPNTPMNGFGITRYLKQLYQKKKQSAAKTSRNYPTVMDMISLRTLRWCSWMSLTNLSRLTRNTLHVYPVVVCSVAC